MAKDKKKKNKGKKAGKSGQTVKRLQALADNPMVANIVASALVATAAAIKDPAKARRLAAQAGDQLTDLAKGGADRGNAMWQLALDVGRRALEEFPGRRRRKRPPRLRRSARRRPPGPPEARDQGRPKRATKAAPKSVAKGCQGRAEKRPKVARKPVAKAASKAARAENHASVQAKEVARERGRGEVSEGLPTPRPSFCILKTCMSGSASPARGTRSTPNKSSALPPSSTRSRSISTTGRAGSLFGSLAASGWHTAALTMRMLVESVPLADGLVGAELRTGLAQADPAGHDSPGVRRSRRDQTVALQAAHGDRRHAQRNPRPGRRRAAGFHGQDAGIQAGTGLASGLLSVLSL